MASDDRVPAARHGPPPRQLSFDLPPEVALGEADFFVSEANRAAHAMLTGPTRWPDGKLALIGPAGAGKSHLARLWAGRAGAEIRTASALAPEAALPPPGAALVLEDLDRAALPDSAETALFHLHNHMIATGGRLLMTARAAPARWPLRLPDLISRMQATTLIRIADPDDRLLQAVLTKLFADRQIAPPPALVPWLSQRIERSFAAAGAIVAALDEAALRTGRPLGQSLARDLLGRSGTEPGPEPEDAPEPDPARSEGEALDKPAPLKE